MNNYTINGYKRISKAAARKVYNAGGEIYMCPVKLAPGGFWRPECSASGAAEYAGRFDSLVNAFEFYNCYDARTGEYTAFYIKQ